MRQARYGPAIETVAATLTTNWLVITVPTNEPAFKVRVNARVALTIELTEPPALSRVSAVELIVMLPPKV